MRVVHAIMMGIIAALALGACSRSVSQTSIPQATVSWVNPSLNTDGSVFNPATDEKQTNVQYGTTSGGPYPNLAVSPADASSVVITLPATPVCGATYYFVAMTVSNDGNVSGPSNEASKALPACPKPTPNPPTNVTSK